MLLRCIFYKTSLWKNTCVGLHFAYREPYVPYEIMVEKSIDSTSSSSNMHGVG